MDRPYDHLSSDYDRYKEGRSSPKDGERDMHERYNHRSPNNPVYVMTNNYQAPSEENRDWREREPNDRSPDRKVVIDTTHGCHDLSPRPGPDYSAVRDRSPKYRRSPERYSSGERRSSSLERVERGFRDSPRDRYRSRSPRSLPPGEENFIRETTVVRIEQIPDDITETEIRVELQVFGAPICSVEMESTSGTDELRGRICFVEFTDIRDSTKWMQQQKGEFFLKGACMLLFFSDRKPQNAPRREKRNDKGRSDSRSSDRDRRGSSRDRRSYDRDRRESSRDRRDYDRDRRDRDDDRRDYDRDRRDRRDRDDDRDRRDDNDRRRDDRGYRRISHEPGERKERDHRLFSSRTNKKTDTMIVMGLDRYTIIDAIKAAFKYITHFNIIDIRLVKDKFGTSRGFCFVQWESVEECSQVLEYLKTATPCFNIEGRQVQLDYSQPRTPEPQSSSSSSANVAAAAIEAAKWSRVGGSSKDSVSETNGAASIAEKAMAQVAKAQEQVQQINKPKPSVAPQNTGTMPMPGQFWPNAMMWQAMASMQAQMQQPQRYPTPDISKYTYDESSGHHYDAATGLYYNSKTRYHYNSFSGVYLYWDQNTHAYIPVSSETQAAQVKAESEKDIKEKEPENKDKSKSAKQIAKDMERWAKAQNKKKEENKRLMDDNSSFNKKESSTGDIGFSLLEKKISEDERRANVKDAFASDLFKSPTMQGMKKVGEVMSPLVMANHPSSAIPGLSSYADGGSDSEEETEQQLSVEEQVEQMTDWNKMACLLCRRAFASKDALQKHQNISDLHKQNIESLRSKTKSAASVAAEQTKYRDRAAERRSKYGIADPPLKKTRYNNRSAVPYEQPTKDGIGDTNIGNKMLQKMGWKSGSGLGKSQSGITVPIVAEQRTMGAGLGMKGSRLGQSSGDSYRDAARQRIMARYQDAE